MAPWINSKSVLFFSVFRPKHSIPKSISHPEIHILQSMMNVVVARETSEPGVGDAEVMLNVMD